MTNLIPTGHVPLRGSAPKKLQPRTTVSAADLSETIQARIYLRRRVGHPPIPSLDHPYFQNPSARPRISHDEHARHFGASAEDIRLVTEFVEANGMRVLEHHAGRRQVVVEGTAGQFSGAFGTAIRICEKEPPEGGDPVRFRDHDELHVPAHLADVIMHVSGISTERLWTTTAQQPTPPNTPSSVTPQQIQSFYNWPTTSAAGQVIGLPSGGGYVITDMYNTFARWGMVSPTVYSVAVDGTATSTATADIETTLDITIAAAFAQHAQIAVYFLGTGTLTDCLARMVQPSPGDPICTVITYSIVYPSEYLLNDGMRNTFDSLLEDCSILNISFFVASGDWGAGGSSTNIVSTNGQTVAYPASSIWATGVGGTTVGNVSGSSFEEWVWNLGTYYNTTGGGISDRASVPSYQKNANLPVSLLTGKPGRGVPDIAALANPGYQMYLNGVITQSSVGTSGASPANAGLIATINAALGYNVGFINPALYAAGNTAVRDINTSSYTSSISGPTNNTGSDTVPGYPVGPGWDACTGLGVINGNAFLSYLRNNKNASQPRIYYSTWEEALFQIYNGGTFFTDGTAAYAKMISLSVDVTSPNDIWNTHLLLPAGKPYLDWLFYNSIPSIDAPTQVTNFAATRTDDNTIVLSWVAPTAGASPFTYSLAVRVAIGSASTEFTGLEKVSTTSYTYSVTIVANQTYTFQVQPISNTGVAGPITLSATVY